MVKSMASSAEGLVCAAEPAVGPLWPDGAIAARLTTDMDPFATAIRSPRRYAYRRLSGYLLRNF
jgi:hypothetical protein